MTELIKIIANLLLQVLQTILTSQSREEGVQLDFRVAVPRGFAPVYTSQHRCFMHPYLLLISASMTANVSVPAFIAFQQTGRIRLPDKVLPDRIRDPIPIQAVRLYFDDD